MTSPRSLHWVAYMLVFLGEIGVPEVLVDSLNGIQKTIRMGEGKSKAIKS